LPDFVATNYRAPINISEANAPFSSTERPM
jgi:hypothetical protein